VRARPPIRILLVDDHALFRKGIASLLASERDFAVVGEAANGRQAVERARELSPDIVLMDVSMPEMGGLEATRQLQQLLPGVRIVMLTFSEEDQDLFEAIKSGARGYLLKKIEPRALFDTLRGVMRDEAPISRGMATRILGEFSRLLQAREAAPEGVQLTAREKDVLRLIAEGKSNKEIAAGLSLAENTVKNHLKNILEKLHLENRVQAAAFAIRQGLAPRSPETR